MAMGRKIGVAIRMVAAMSMKVPSRNRITLISRNTCQGSSETLVIQLPMKSATSYSPIRYWNIADTPISSSTTPVVFTALAPALMKLCQVMVR
ncbi:hypothetical protein D3C71_1596620 [compost metagenome]